MSADHGGPALDRRLGTGDAVFIGLGSMLGAGVFAAFAPAAEAAGAALLIGLALAAVVAYCNATASAQLAAAHPQAGGTYLYGRRQLGPWWGFVAGWGFLVGKTASCAAMALTFAAYAAPGAYERVTAVAAIVALTAVNYRGITRTARLTRVLVVVVLVVLAVVVAAGLGSGAPDGLPSLDPSDALSRPGGRRGTLQSAGLLFFAFAGYARLATLGEEVRDPARTIPRAIPLALGLAVAVYAAVAVAALLALGPDRLAGAPAPLAATVQAASWDPAAPLVRLGAAAASLGALLALIAGVGRTTLAMARHGDLPRWLSAVHPGHRVPHHAEVALGALVGTLVLTVDLRGAIGFSSFGVLVYYLVANLSAFTQRGDQRRYPRALQVLGGLGCGVLALTLPGTAVLTGSATLVAGLAYRALRIRVVGRRA